MIFRLYGEKRENITQWIVSHRSSYTIELGPMRFLKRYVETLGDMAQWYSHRNLRIQNPFSKSCSTLYFKVDLSPFLVLFLS